MALKSSIEWTESTWNPVTGCNKISPGCKFCYAERMAKRLKAMGSENYKDGFKLSIHESALYLPLTWKKPQTIFVNSMSDLFHKDIPVNFLMRTIEVMNKANWHNFQVLTKRSDILLKLNPIINWSENIWMGVSVENQNYTYRIDHLRRTNAYIKFLSIELLIGPIDNLDLTNIDWVIVGGESGPGARPMEESWVLKIRDICKKSKVPFFFKQWGGVQKKKNGRLLKGKTWDQMPKLKKAA
jgi:protein gp37